MSAAQSRSAIWPWIPPVVWGVVIWQLGGDDFSAPETSRILGPLVAWLFPDLDMESRDAVVAGIRKLAHPGVYGLLAGLTLNAVARTLHLSTIPRAAFSLAPVVLLAAADEWRQSTSAARTGAGFDVLLDVAGGIAVILFLMALDAWLPGRLFGKESATPDQRTPV